MKICLINPPQILNKRFGKPFVFQPLGLLYVAAVLEKEYSVEVIDASLEGWRSMEEIDDKYHLGLSFDDIREKIKAIDPDIVGISVPFSINEASALSVASLAKDINKNIITILGGAHPSVHPEETLLSDHVDFVVIGEGEHTTPELIKTLQGGSREKLKDVAGIGYKDGGRPVITPQRALIQDLDSIPFPARHLVPMEEYFNMMQVRKGARDMYTYSERWVSVISSRGCPFNCTFCSIHLVMGNKFRARSPENVMSELKQVINDYNVRHINFEDDNLTLNKSRVGHIFDLMIENKLDLTWSTPNGIRGDILDEELVRKMKDSGCKRVFVAPESGDQRVVNEIIGKRLDLKKIETAVTLFKKYGIIVDGSFVMGLIGETKNDIWTTIKYALRLKKLGMEAAGLHIATPYYGTKLYEQALQEGALRTDLDSSLLSTGESSISTPEWSTLEIHRLHKIASWLLKNHNSKGIYIYMTILQKYPWIFPYLKLTHRIILYLLKIPVKLYHIMKSWATLVKNAAVNITQKATNTLPTLEYIVYEVTDACNSRCQHCYIWKHTPSKDMLTAKELGDMLSKDFFSDLKVLLLTGGEAVLKKDIKEIIATIHKVRPNVQITLSTNALWPERVLEVVNHAIDNNVKLSVGISLDAIGKRHDEIRGVEGNFKKVNYLIGELIKLKEKDQNNIGAIVVGHTLSNLSTDTLQDVLDYAQKSKIGFITQLHEEFDYYHNEDEDNAIQNYRSADNLTLINTVNSLKPSFHNEMLLSSLKHTLKYRCASMRSFFLLKCTGEISPCLCYSNISAGNVKQNSLPEIWNSEAASKARKVVGKCQGCSNSWATSWSFESWFPSFLRIRISLMKKNFLLKLKSIRE